MQPTPCRPRDFRGELHGYPGSRDQRGSAIRQLYPQLLRRLKAAGVTPAAGPAIAYYEDPDEPSDAVTVHAGIPVTAGQQPSRGFAVVASLARDGEPARGVVRRARAIHALSDDDGARLGRLWESECGHAQGAHAVGPARPSKPDCPPSCSQRRSATRVSTSRSGSGWSTKTACRVAGRGPGSCGATRPDGVSSR